MGPRAIAASAASRAASGWHLSCENAVTSSQSGPHCSRGPQSGGGVGNRSSKGQTRLSNDLQQEIKSSTEGESEGGVESAREICH